MGPECSLGLSLGSFGCLQAFLKGSWVKRTEKKGFSCEEEMRGEPSKEQRKWKV